MNAVHMFNPKQASFFSVSANSQINPTDEESNPFIQLLARTISEATEQQRQSNYDEEGSLDSLFENLPEEMIEKLVALFSEFSLSNLEESNLDPLEDLDIEKILSMITHEKDIEEMLPLLASKQMSDLTVEQWLDKKNDSDVILQSPFINDLLGLSQSNETDEVLKESDQITHLLTSIEKLLANVTNEQDVKQVAPKLLELLEEWTRLEGKLNENESTVLDNKKTREQKIWQDLLSFYQKRNGLVRSTNPYKQEAGVTTKDIANWLSSALETNQHAEAIVSTQQQQPLATMPISRIEQYVIYLNQADQVQPVDKQLMDQFQHAIKSSRFLSMNNGMNQLSFTLRPDNLGEMVVRLVEIQGEMTVKIMVSSQATRKMLEANIHQLKHMFSPQQVIVEERELTIQDIEGNDEEQLFNEEEESHSEQSNKDKQEHDEDTSFGAQFQEFLLNEEV